MPDLRSRRRMASAAGISLLLHLAVLGALSLIGPHFAAEDTVGNESDDSRMTIHALQDGPDARGSARSSSAEAPGSEPTTPEQASDRPSSAEAPNPDPPTEHESPDFTAAEPEPPRSSPDAAQGSDPTASEPTTTEPASSRPSPDTPPSSDPSRRVTGHTTSLPEGESKPDPEPEERRSAQIVSRKSESAIRTAEPSAPPAPGDAARPLPDSAAAPDNAAPAGDSVPPAPGNAAPPFPGNAAPRGSRPTGERPAQRDTEDSGVSRSELVRALYDELEEAFHYPAIARRRALEGSVELLVEVAVDGELRSLTVEQSSGSRILDDAATETVTRLFPRSRAQRSTHQVRLRVRYELN